MPSLNELQRQLAHAILRGDSNATFGNAFKAWPIPMAQALSVHRNTVFGSLRDALRLSYPTVVALIGDECFTQLIRHYAAQYPPKTACLSRYGENLPSYLQQFPLVAALPYLSDVASFDWHIERAAAALADDALTAAISVEIDGVLQLRLAPSLTVFECDYPVDEIREAIVVDDDAQLGQLDMNPQRRWFAIWRNDNGASVRALGATAACFLAELLKGRDAVTAVETAAASRAGRSAITEIEADVFRASFATLIPYEITARGEV